MSSYYFVLRFSDPDSFVSALSFVWLAIVLLIGVDEGVIRWLYSLTLLFEFCGYTYSFKKSVE